MKRLILVVLAASLAMLVWRVVREALPWDPEIQPELDEPEYGAWGI